LTISILLTAAKGFVDNGLQSLNRFIGWSFEISQFINLAMEPFKLVSELNLKKL